MSKEGVTIEFSNGLLVAQVAVRSAQSLCKVVINPRWCFGSSVPSKSRSNGTLVMQKGTCMYMPAIFPF